MVDIGDVRLGNKLQWFSLGAKGAPVQRGRDLHSGNFLGRAGIVAQDDVSAGAQPFLFGLNAYIQIVFNKSERLAINCRTICCQAGESQQNSTQLHSGTLTAPLARLCRTISKSTTPAATDTFSDETLPSIVIETRKSHFLRTRSCTPLPSAPSTMAQSML